MNLTKTAMIIALSGAALVGCKHQNGSMIKDDTVLAQDPATANLANKVFHNSPQDMNAILKHYYANGVLFIKYGAEWCGPCHQFGPTMDAVASDSVAGKYMVVDVDFDHMQEWIQKAGQLTDDQKNYKQSHVWLGSIKPTTNIPDGVIIVNKQVVWKGGVVGIAAETIKANLRQYAAQIQPIQTAPDTANAASGNQQQEQGQEQDQNQNQGQNQNIQNNQPFTVELGDEFNKQTFTVKYDALGKAVQLLDPYGRTIDLANQSEIFAGANQYKVEKDSSGAVSHLLLCQENMGCQRIPLYR